MESYILDIYLDDVNKWYLNRLSFLALFKARSMGYRCAADLFCDAYFSYNPNYTPEFLSVLETSISCRQLIKQYGISYKEDLLYLIRHPQLTRTATDRTQKQVRKKVIQFMDMDNPENAYKKEAYNALKSLRPVKRAQMIDGMITQFLIITENEFFAEQSARRLMDDIIAAAEFDEDGTLIGPAKKAVDFIWKTSAGRQEKEKNDTL